MPGNAELAAKETFSYYADVIRPLLLEHGSPHVASIDQAMDVLKGALQTPKHINIGFLGAAQVGKSSLINALLDNRLLPAGGIGPLTAQATRISFAEEGRLRVTYHGKQRLNKLRFGIERYLHRKGLAAAGQSNDEIPQGVDEQDPELLGVGVSVDASLEQDGREERASPGKYMLEQARMMLCDAQEVNETIPAPVILDGIRAVLGQTLKGSRDALAPLEARITELRARLGTTTEILQRDIGKRQFEREIRLHAADWLSPLVEQLDLETPVAFLQGITLVDLPGVGVFADPSGRVAEEFIPDADGLVLVMRHDGLTDSVNSVLERTGVITKRLFHGVSDPSPIHVAIAITCLDNVAREQYMKDREQAEEDDLPPPQPDKIFARLSEDMAKKVRAMMQDALLSSKAFEVLSDEDRRRREAVVMELCRTMDVVCVASPDYMHLSKGLGGTFLMSTAATGVPTFRECLQRLPARAQARREENIEQALKTFYAMLDGSLFAIQQMYLNGGGKAVANWEKFRADLLAAATPLREQMAAHQGEARATLKNSLPESLRRLTLEAQNKAQRKLRRLHEEGWDLHYRTLNAALTRNGVFDRRDIDYPGDLTITLVDSIATAWEPTVIEAVRAAIRTLAARNAKLVERLCEHAQELDERIVADAHIETQKRLLQERAKTCVAWTKDRLEHLNQDVYRKLHKVVGKPIESACQRAVQLGSNRGTGAKGEILRAFQQGGEQAIEQAGEAALRILREHYDRLHQELNEGFFDQAGDPLQAALNAMTSEELMRARRADARRKQEVVALVNDLRERLKQRAFPAASDNKTMEACA